MRRSDRRRSPRLMDRVAEWDAHAPEPPYEARFWRGERPADASGGQVGVVYTRARLLAGLTPVVFVKGNGAIALTHVEPLR